MIVLTMYPVLRFNITKVKYFPNPPFRLLDIILWTYVACMVIKLPYDIIHIQTGLTYIMLDMGSEVYSNSMMESQVVGNSGISSIPTIFVNITTEIVILLTFYNIFKKRNKIQTICVIIAIFISPLGSIASGQRTGVFDTVIAAIGSYFLFAPVLDRKIRKNVNKIGLGLIIALSIPIFALTQSRFGSGGRTVEQSVFSYLGQENLNFDLYAFDNNGIRYGDRVFPLFKKMLGYDNVPSDFWERRDKYSNLKINDEVFIGYIGDFLLDFGPFISTLMFILFAGFSSYFTQSKHGILKFYQLLIIQYVLVIGLQGGLRLFPFADNYGLKIIAYGLLFVYLYTYSRNKIYNKPRHKYLS